MKIAFIVKGLIKNKARLLQELKNNFPEADVFETLRAAHAIELARDTAEKIILTSSLWVARQN